MAAGDTAIGTGTTLTHLNFTMELLDISWDGLERESIATSHMGTTVAATFLPTTLYDGGEITAEVHLKTNEAPPITVAAQTTTITFPDGETWAALAFLRSFTFNDPLEGVMTATAVFKVSGAVTF